MKDATCISNLQYENDKLLQQKGMQLIENLNQIYIHKIKFIIYFFSFKYLMTFLKLLKLKLFFIIFNLGFLMSSVDIGFERNRQSVCNASNFWNSVGKVSPILC